MEFRDQLALGRLREKLQAESDHQYAQQMRQLDGACGIARRSFDEAHASSHGHLLMMITQARDSFYEFRCTGCDWSRDVTAFQASAEPAKPAKE